MSLFDKELIEQDDLYKQQVLEFIYENYTCYGDLFVDESTQLVNCSGSVVSKLFSSATQLTNGLFGWGEVDGEFLLLSSRIKSTKGCPVKCKKFIIDGAEILTVLDYVPAKCDLISIRGSKIENITASANEVNVISIADNSKLLSLGNLLDVVIEMDALDIHDNIRLNTIPHFPQKLQIFDIRYCPKLTDLSSCAGCEINQMYIDFPFEMMGGYNIDGEYSYDYYSSKYSIPQDMISRINRDDIGKVSIFRMEIREIVALANKFNFKHGYNHAEYDGYINVPREKLLKWIEQ